MAIVRMFGGTFLVDLIAKLSTKSLGGEDQYLAISRAHTARTAPGTTITVLQSEILEAAAAEMPADTGFPTPIPPKTDVDLQKAMADERAALDKAGLSAANLIEKYRATLKEAGKLGGTQ